MSNVSFQSALQRLVTDETYRHLVAKNGEVLQNDFNLTKDNMTALKAAASGSGWLDAAALTLDDMACCCCCCP